MKFVFLGQLETKAVFLDCVFCFLFTLPYFCHFSRMSATWLHIQFANNVAASEIPNKRLPWYEGQAIRSFPSNRLQPFRSLIEGKRYVVRALLSKSFTISCLNFLPTLRLHDKTECPKLSTWLPLESFAALASNFAFSMFEREFFKKSWCVLASIRLSQFLNLEAGWYW